MNDKPTILIDYTLEEMNGEPGPNFFWLGSVDGMKAVVEMLYPLATETSKSVEITDGNGFKLKGITKVILQSADGSKNFVTKHNNTIIVTLDKRHWREVIHSFVSITFDSGFNFVEFDNEDFVEEAKWIIESRRAVAKVIEDP